jgi:hypothetical protein
MPFWVDPLMIITMPSLAIGEARMAAEDAQHEIVPPSITNCQFNLGSLACESNSCFSRCVDTNGTTVLNKLYDGYGYGSCALMR